MYRLLYTNVCEVICDSKSFLTLNTTHEFFISYYIFQPSIYILYYLVVCENIRFIVKKKEKMSLIPLAYYNIFILYSHAINNNPFIRTFFFFFSQNDIEIKYARVPRIIVIIVIIVSFFFFLVFAFCILPGKNECRRRE